MDYETEAMNHRSTTGDQQTEAMNHQNGTMNYQTEPMNQTEATNHQTKTVDKQTEANNTKTETNHQNEAPNHQNEASIHQNEAPNHQNEASIHQNEASNHQNEAPNHQTANIDLRKFSNDEVRKMRPKKALETAFDEFMIDDGSFLDAIDGRHNCDLCGKSRKYFCYTCCVPLPIIAERVPKIKLPFKIDVLKHPKEIDGKSTAVHAAIIAPDDVNIYTYPALPDYTKEQGVLLIFPDKKAVRISEIATLFNKKTLKHQTKKLKPMEKSKMEKSEMEKPDIPFTKAVFIDCTWNQTRKIYNDERVRDLPCVELDSKETLFWRYQKGKPNTYLATIEAIYYFIVEVHTKYIRDEYKQEYDNLLFFFKYMFDKIHNVCDVNSLRAFKDVPT